MLPPASGARGEGYFINCAFMPSLPVDGISGYGHGRGHHRPRHGDVRHAPTATRTIAWSANSSGMRETARNCRGRTKRYQFRVWNVNHAH